MNEKKIIITVIPDEENVDQYNLELTSEIPKQTDHDENGIYLNPNRNTIVMMLYALLEHLTYIKDQSIIDKAMSQLTKIIAEAEIEDFNKWKENQKTSE